MAEGCGGYDGDITSDAEVTTVTIKHKKPNKRKQAAADSGTPAKATHEAVACSKQATPAPAAGDKSKVQAVVLRPTFRRHVKEFSLKHIKWDAAAIGVAHSESNTVT